MFSDINYNMLVKYKHFKPILNYMKLVHTNNCILNIGRWPTFTRICVLYLDVLELNCLSYNTNIKNQYFDILFYLTYILQYLLIIL